MITTQSAFFLAGSPLARSRVAGLATGCKRTLTSVSEV